MKISTLFVGFTFFLLGTSIFPQGLTFTEEHSGSHQNIPKASKYDEGSYINGGIEGGFLSIGSLENPRLNPYYARVFAKYFWRRASLEAGLGYFNTFDHKHDRRLSSDIISADLRVNFNFRETTVSPYMYPFFGIGAVYSEYKNPPSSELIFNGKTYAVDMMLIAGIGFEILLSEQTALGLELGHTWLSSYYTTGTVEFKKKGFYTLGTRFSFGKNGFVRDSDKDGIRNSDEEDIYRTDPENPDTDGDRVSDYDEIFRYKTDPLKADTDGDGVSDGDEIYKYGTLLLKVDSDGDGISDGDEIFQYKTNPLSKDTDGDGISDYYEIFKHNSDPLKADTDGDGIDDYQEIYFYKTNPALADTDGDGITDLDEVKKYKTDPVKLDSDGDGFNDYQEIYYYKTNPLLTDSDSDGVTDFDEVTYYKTNPLLVDTDIDQIYDGDEVFKYKTDPLTKDSDKDGLDDYQEIFYYRTNPLLVDSDGSGVDDKTEVERGTDPIDVEDDVIDVNKIIVLEGIEFEFKKANITPESDRRLQKTLKLLKAFPNYKFSLEGHTDDIGGKQFNQKLSVERANAVKTWLVNQGIDSRRLTVKGFGFDRPIATNSTEEGRQRNRRVEFIRTN